MSQWIAAHNSTADAVPSIVGPLVLKCGERIGLADTNSSESLEYAPVNGTIDERASHRPLENGIRNQVHVKGKSSLHRNSGEHREAPWVATQQPVDLPGSKALILTIAGHALVENGLGCQRHHQIV